MKRGSFWYPSIVGFLSTLMGLALCRFSYTPMIPFLVHANWLSSNEANYVGSFNFAGYFIGAVLAFQFSKQFDKGLILRISFLLACISIFLCAWDLGFYWIGFWRFIGGVVGAFLVILSPSLVLAKVPHEKAFLASGIMFMGAGFGIIFSSLGVPELVRLSLDTLWPTFGVLSLIFTIVTWPFFKATGTNQKTAVGPLKLNRGQCATLCLVGLGYLLCGVGVVPHTLFLSHYLYQDLHFSVQSSGSLFALFGLGCLAGSFLGGVVAGKIGVYAGLVLSYIIGFVAVLMVVLSHHSAWVLLSAVLIGMFLFACVNLTSLRVREIVSSAHHPKYWGYVTLCFAIGQAIGAYGMSSLISHGYSYIQMFWVAVIALGGGVFALLGARLG